MKTSVIIPTWIIDDSKLEIVKNCVSSFRSSDVESLELVVIDNASSVGGGYLRDIADIYVRFPENLGFTPAINAGIKIANGDVLAFANDDIRVPPNWDKVCREILDNRQVGTVHPKMIPYDTPFGFGDFTSIGGMERWCGGSFMVTTRRFLDFMRDKERWIQPYPGLYDENFGIGGGGDDWDWVYRIRDMASQAYTNKTAFQHLDSYTLKKLGARRNIIAQQNDEYFTKKWGIKKEVLFASQFPKQMEVDYREGFI